MTGGEFTLLPRYPLNVVIVHARGWGGGGGGRGAAPQQPCWLVVRLIGIACRVVPLDRQRVVPPLMVKMYGSVKRVVPLTSFLVRGSPYRHRMPRGSPKL